MTPEISATQIAQEKLQTKTDQQLKHGPSKFDQALEAKAPGGVDGTPPVDATTKADAVRQVDSVTKAEKISLADFDSAATKELSRHGSLPPPTPTAKAELSQSTHMMAEMLGELEKGQNVMDKLIKAGVSGKNFSQTELLSLQASVYKYTQELELTGKVVEKATTGLKDTLKTQV